MLVSPGVARQRRRDGQVPRTLSTSLGYLSDRSEAQTAPQAASSRKYLHTSVIDWHWESQKGCAQQLCVPLHHGAAPDPLVGHAATHHHACAEPLLHCPGRALCMVPVSSQKRDNIPTELEYQRSCPFSMQSLVGIPASHSRTHPSATWSGT